VFDKPGRFPTVPFPAPIDAQREAIAEAARELDRLRNNWLNPPEWTREEVLGFPRSAGGPDDGLLARLLELNLARAGVDWRRVVKARTDV